MKATLLCIFILFNNVLIAQHMPAWFGLDEDDTLVSGVIISQKHFLSTKAVIFNILETNKYKDENSKDSIHYVKTIINCSFENDSVIHRVFQDWGYYVASQKPKNSTMREDDIIVSRGKLYDYPYNKYPLRKEKEKSKDSAGFKVDYYKDYPQKKAISYRRSRVDEKNRLVEEYFSICKSNNEDGFISHQYQYQGDSIKKVDYQSSDNKGTQIGKQTDIHRTKYGEDSTLKVHYLTICKNTLYPNETEWENDTDDHVFYYRYDEKKQLLKVTHDLSIRHESGFKSDLVIDIDYKTKE